jgi:hypothetical protein
LNLLHKFEPWWRSSWRSRDKMTQQYQPPRPEQVVELWLTAMKSLKTETVEIKPTQLFDPDNNIMAAMRARANERHKK